MGGWRSAGSTENKATQYILKINSVTDCDCSSTPLQEQESHENAGFSNMGRGDVNSRPYGWFLVVRTSKSTIH